MRESVLRARKKGQTSGNRCGGEENKDQVIQSLESQEKDGDLNLRALGRQRRVLSIKET